MCIYVHNLHKNLHEHIHVHIHIHIHIDVPVHIHIHINIHIHVHVHVHVHVHYIYIHNIYIYTYTQYLLCTPQVTTSHHKITAPACPGGGEVVLPDTTGGLVAAQVVGAEADVLDHQLLPGTIHEG